MMQSAALMICLLAAGIQPEAVAVTDAGPVSVADVDREMEFMTTREKRYREETGVSSEKTRRDIIERIALRVIAAKQTLADGSDQDPVIRERARDAGRRWLIGAWRKNRWGLDESRLPSEELVRRELEDSVPAPPDRLRLSHIYLPAPTDRAQEAARVHMEQWRAESRDLATFRQLAEEHSSSQDRDRGGRMGWLRRGFLDPGLEEVLFELEAGSVSPPLYFDGGMHLFFVEDVEVDRTPRLDAHVKTEVNHRLRELLESRRADLLEQARETYPVRIERDEASEWPDLRVGAWTVSGEVLRALSGSQTEINRTVRDWIEGELLYQSALQSDWMTARFQARLGDLQAQALHDTAAALWVSKQMDEPAHESVRHLIMAEPQRFHHRLRLEVRAAAVPLDGESSPRSTARSLTEIAEALASGRLSWDAAAQTFPPSTEVFHHPLSTDLDLAGTLGPRVFKEIAQAQPGAVHGPIQSEGKLWLIQVVDRMAPSPLDEADAEAKARKILLSRQAARLGSEFGDRRLAEHGFRLTELGMSQVRETPNPLEANR